MKLLSCVLAALTLAASSACFADQPNMQGALASLLQARESLQKATHDKGGHRVKAIKAIDAAIVEVQAGINFDRTHLTPQEKAKR